MSRCVPVQLMDAGTHGVLGAAAVKPAAVEISRGSASAKGLSSAVSRAPAKRGSRSAATKSDALVCDPETVKSVHTKTIKQCFIPVLVPILSLEPHEICAEQNTGEAVWRKTPAGDEAAVPCPADASGTNHSRCILCFLFVFSAAACFHYASSIINKHFLR